MKIGNGWTKTTEKGETYISISLDEILGIILPFLKPLLEKCFITFWHIPKEERKKENSPDWSINLSVKKDNEEISF